MTSYGFRLFSLAVKKNGRGDEQSLLLDKSDEKSDEKKDEKKEHFRDYLKALATSRIGHEVHGNPPRDSDGADLEDDEADDVDDTPTTGPSKGQKPRPVLCILEVIERGDHFYVDFVYGTRSTYTHAGFSEEVITSPVDIANLKSVRPYRAAFLFPAKGSQGLMAIEDANRTCPRLALQRWLKHWARADAKELEVKRSELAGKRKKVNWWSMSSTPVNDPKRLSAVLKGGTSTQLVLTKQGGSNSRTPGPQDLKIQMGLQEAGVIARVRETITRWFPDGTKPNISQDEANADLAAILADQYTNFDGGEYDDAWVDIKDSNNNVTHVSPSRWADIFTYPISKANDRPPTAAYCAAVHAAIKPIESALGVKVDWTGW